MRKAALTFQLAKRDLILRYKGSLFSTSWLVITPLIMLFVYVFVFSEIFKVKWPSAAGPQSQEQAPAHFGLMLLIGLSVFQFFSDCLTKSTSAVTSSPNLITKVVFPTETLPASVVVAALFHFAISFLLIIGGKLIFTGSIGSAALFAPIIFVIMFFFALGCAWILAAIGVYVRDLTHTVALVMGGLMFLTPVFFPASAFPKKFAVFLDLNPIAYFIEALRSTIMLNELPALEPTATYLIVATVICFGGYRFFQKAKRGFADVI